VGATTIARSKSDTSTPTVTLPAELLKTIEANHAKVGDEITARTATALDITGIKFPVGALVQGHITKVEPNLLVMVFNQIAVKKEPPVSLGLSLRAVMMPQAPPKAMSQQISPSAEAANSGGLLRSPTVAAQDSSVSIFDSSQHPVMAGNGEVVGLSGVKLMVSSDPKAGSAFQSEPAVKLKLEKGLQLMFRGLELSFKELLITNLGDFLPCPESTDVCVCPR
jgi:hypothetical protein